MHKIELSYALQGRPGPASGIRNPLLDLLHAVQAQGSISGAARELGMSYRHVWGALRRWEEELAQPLIVWEKGQRAQLTPFAGKLLFAERQAQARLAPQIEALHAELERAFAVAFDPDAQVLTLFASHDDALARLRAHAADAARLHLDIRFCGSVDAIAALNEGRCAVAGFHVPAHAPRGSTWQRTYQPLLQPGLHKLIGFARRSQGLVVARGNPLGIRGVADLARGSPLGSRGVADLARGSPLGSRGVADLTRGSALGSRGVADLAPGHSLGNRGVGDLARGHPLRDPGEEALARGGVRFVNRTLGSGTRLLLDALLAEHGMACGDVQGYERAEPSHEAVAQAVAAGEADAGLAIAAVAQSRGLDFIPLVEEDYLLVCLKDVLEQRPTQLLREVLQSAAWRDQLGAIAGYAPARTGEVLSLREEMPWWDLPPKEQ